MRKFTKALTLAVLFTYISALADADATEIRVRYLDGLSRGFMVLRTQDGIAIADGEDSQILKHGIVSSHLVFRFKDGSIYDDTTTFSQEGTFRLLTDHLVQKGPTFPIQMESWIDTASGHVRVHSVRAGKPENSDEVMRLPTDVANGLLFTLPKSLLSTPSATVSYVAFSPKPRLVSIVYSQEGHDQLATHTDSYKATRFVMKVEIGGIGGVVASLTKKKPADTRMWFIGGEAPVFAASEGPLYGQGPVWKIELISPSQPKTF
jgi:hypothetical protein